MSCLSQSTHLEEVAADVGQRCDPEKGPRKPGQAAGQHIAPIGVPVQAPRIDALPEPQRPVPPAMNGENGHSPMPQPPACAHSEKVSDACHQSKAQLVPGTECRRCNVHDQDSTMSPKAISARMLVVKAVSKLCRWVSSISIQISTL